MLLVDTTITASLGAVRGLEDLRKAIENIRDKVTGIILNPGQCERMAGLLGGRGHAVSLVRTDWTNIFRSTDFAIPMETPSHIMLASGEDVLEIGGCAAVAFFLFGYDDDFEAQNIALITYLLRECNRIGMPVMADVRLNGPKITEANFKESAALAVSFMQEGGADVISIPYPGEDVFKMIMEFATVPILLRETNPHVIETGIKLGASGAVLSEEILASDNFMNEIDAIRKLVV
jgi:DhnA family fructose-bisphosphate aldolase class Ia